LVDTVASADDRNRDSENREREAGAREDHAGARERSAGARERSADDVVGKLRWMVIGNLVALAAAMGAVLWARDASEDSARTSREAAALVVQLDAAVQQLAGLQQANRTALESIQASRYEASYRACRNLVRIGQDNVRFLRRLGVRDDAVIEAAREVYRVKRDCVIYARRQTDVDDARTGDPLQLPLGPFPGP
jgi:hypothetical protein